MVEQPAPLMRNIACAAFAVHDLDPHSASIQAEQQTGRPAKCCIALFMRWAPFWAPATWGEDAPPRLSLLFQLGCAVRRCCAPVVAFGFRRKQMMPGHAARARGSAFAASWPCQRLALWVVLASSRTGHLETPPCTWLAHLECKVQASPPLQQNWSSGCCELLWKRIVFSPATYAPQARRR